MKRHTFQPNGLHHEKCCVWINNKPCDKPKESEVHK